jgi:tRNA threonylcarbamoyladenosine biosynthesis protein TsaE
MRLEIATAEQMRELGGRIAAALRPGDLVLLDGDLGAGKTTLTQGIGAGLGVSVAVTSPTFVIARVHRDGRIPLVHVDAFRLGATVDVDDLDLDASVGESATVVEWGEGLVEGLSPQRLEIRIDRPVTDSDETRTVTLRAVGERWAGFLDSAGPLADHR